MKIRPVADVSNLPTYGFGSQSPIWWGTLAFVALEGTGFALAIGAYLYLAHLAPSWPIAPPQHDIWAATILTLLLLASVVPNLLLDRWAKRQDLRKVRFGLVVMSLFGIAPLVARIFEFGALTVLWDTNAYGSVIWFLLGLHTTHLLTDAGDTIVLTVLMFTRHARSGKRLSDVSDNAFYWHFVVASWLPIYLLLYWVQ
ncbi:cytochrome c oxidase subunit 3 [Inquilinus sp. Marseille-Q2685]|uniref:cytochrome c oxidase subunit 3 n=1 Tax=Inquilinus sp. Marseille-Q2685 TaxID=2866581 RepID=UPI001CE3FED5|nr:cytochrome c oxidase subunit 3 [Inquilinus sp. Marseille-Q2685]